MRRIPRPAILLVALALAEATAQPLAAAEPPAASIQIEVDGVGYITPDMGGVNVAVWCDAWGDEPRYFWLEGWSFPIRTDPIEVPAGSSCDIIDVAFGDPGDLAYWTHWLDTPSGSFAVPTGPPTTVSIEVGRAYNGGEPLADDWAWFGLETFAVDRVYLNRYGGVTAEGLILCRGLADFYGIEPGLGESPALGIDWQATQYVGRRTAIHGTYLADIANFCFDPASPTVAQRWRSLHPAGDEAVTAWVYGEEGRFGSGSIRIDAAVLGQSLFVVQWWNQGRADYAPDRCGITGELEFTDVNHDGFCAVQVEVGQRTTANLKTLRLH